MTIPEFEAICDDYVSVLTNSEPGIPEHDEIIIVDDGSELRSSIGIGVEWFTPVGPLSFSFAAPISKSSSDKTETFRFNLGTTF